MQVLMFLLFFQLVVDLLLNEDFDLVVAVAVVAVGLVLVLVVVILGLQN